VLDCQSGLSGSGAQTTVSTDVVVGTSATKSAPESAEAFCVTGTGTPSANPTTDSGGAAAASVSSSPPSPVWK